MLSIKRISVASILSMAFIFPAYAANNHAEDQLMGPRQLLRPTQLPRHMHQLLGPQVLRPVDLPQQLHQLLGQQLMKPSQMLRPSKLQQQQEQNHKL